MKRRDFIRLVGGTVFAWSLGARAQQPTMPVIGFLGGESPDVFAERVRAFHQGLSETGYVEGQNVAIEYRWAESQYGRLPELAADLVRRQVAVIAAIGGTPPVLAAKAATTTIPIIFHIGGDPVRIGLVSSMNRPGGNLTGVSNLNVELGPKRLELLRELAPSAGIVALLINPTNPAVAEPLSRDSQAAARALGLQLRIVNASTEREIDAVFATLSQLGAGALAIGPSAFFNGRSNRLGALTVRYAIPAIYQFREFAAAGGLMSYGGSSTDAHRHVGIYTGRILKGEKPADLPVMQATKVELIINLKTAKALGITVPLSLLGRADEVIE